jgi:SPOR domain
MNTLRKARLASAAVLAVAALVACDSLQDDWNKASAQNTLAAYQDFLNQHPNTDLAARAQSRIHTLQDDEAWAQAQKANTAESFRQYLSSQPNGLHAAESHERISEFERADAWRAAEADGKVSALRAFVQKYPRGAESDRARAQIAQLQAEAYRVQVAAYRARKDAERARARLQARYREVLHEVVVVPPAAPEKLTTIRSMPMTLKEAESACGTLRKEHQHCEVVKG